MVVATSSMTTTDKSKLVSSESMASVPQEVLTSFWSLSSKHEPVRLKSSQHIVDHVKNSPQSLDYVLKRLVRGTSAEEKCTRIGFYTVLVQVIKMAVDKEFVVQRVLKEIKELNHTKSASKSEASQQLCGRLLCLGALLRSGQVKVEEKETLKMVIEQLVEVGKKRSYLSNPVYVFLIDYINALDSEEEVAQMWPLLESLHEWKSDDVISLDVWWLLLSSYDRNNKVGLSLAKSMFGSKKLINERFMEQVAKSIKDAALALEQFRSHPIFPILLRVLNSNALLHTFFLRHVDPLFTRFSSHRSLTAFHLTELILNIVEDKEAMKYFTPNVMEVIYCMMSKLEPVKEEEQTSKRVFELFIKKSSIDEASQTSFLNRVLKTPGNVAFDKATGSSYVFLFITKCKVNAIKTAGNVFVNAASGSMELNLTNAERCYAFTQLTRLMNLPIMETEMEWKKDISTVLATLLIFDLSRGDVSHSLLMDRKKLALPSTGSIAMMTRDTWMKMRDCLFKAIHMKTKSMRDTVSLLETVVDRVQVMLDDRPDLPRPQSFTKEAMEKWTEVRLKVDKLRKKESDKVFELLMLCLGLQLFIEPESALEALRDVEECWRRSKESKKSRKKENTDDDLNDDQNDPEWVEVVVDVLLSLLAQNKQFMRQLVRSVFPMFCSHINTNALQAVLDVVQPQEEVVAIKNDAQEDEDIEDDDEGEDEEEEEQDDDDEEDDDDDEEDDEDDEDEAMEREEKSSEMESDSMDLMKVKIQAALGDQAINDDQSDRVSVDLDDVDDESMRRLDEALSQAFRQISSGRKRVSTTKREKMDAMALVHFKTRALDLLEIALNHQPRLSHALRVLDTCLKAIRESSLKTEAGFITRLVSIVSKVASLKEKDLRSMKEDQHLEAQFVTELLEGVLKMGRGHSASSVIKALNSNRGQPLYGQCCLFLLRAATLASEDTKVEARNLYLQALEDFLYKRHCHLPLDTFLVPLKCGWEGSWLLCSKLTTFLSSSEDPLSFKRSRPMMLLSVLLRNRSFVEQQIDSETKNSVLSDLTSWLVKDLEKIIKMDEVKGRPLLEMLSVIQALKMIDAPVQWTEMKPLLMKMRRLIPNKKFAAEVRKMYNKVAAPLGIDVIMASEKNGKKDKHCEEVDNEDDVGRTKDAEQESKMSRPSKKANDEERKEKKKKKKRRRTDKESSEARKKRRHFELEGQFASMEMPNFNGMHTISDDHDDN